MELPKGWMLSTVGAMFKLVGGGTPSTSNAEYWGEGTPWFSSADIDDFGVITPRRYVTPVGVVNSTTQVVPKGSVLVVTRVGLGKVAILKDAMCFSQDNQALVPLYPNFIDMHYLFVFLKQAMQTVKYKGQGTTISGITKKQLEDVAILVPPLPEQRRIVEKIDALFSELDKGVETLRTVKAQLKVYRQAVLKEAFEGRLTGTHMQKERKLIDLCFFITKGTTPKNSEMSAVIADIPFVKVYNLTFDGRLDFTVEPTYVSSDVHRGFLARSIVKPGDVLMNIVGPPMGKVSIVPNSFPEWNINQAIVRFRCNKELHNRYLAYFLLYNDTVRAVSRKAKATAGQFNLTLEICRSIEIPYCFVDDQKHITAAIDSRLSICDHIDRLVDDSIAKAAALRQSILKQAFAGRLVPQDPSDEPADVTLARMKKEQATVIQKASRGRKRRG